MNIEIKFKFANANVDTKEMELVCIPARKRMIGPDEKDAMLCIGGNVNLAIAEIHTGDMESSNALCEEICRRFNEFPKEQKL
ncbi:MAG: hypothetical protein K2N34_06245 [Lachnospiraceae bacterium]|nr:hypothetical protein [Lachnospiraceae bacterium]